MTYDMAALTALSDPTRRLIFERLSIGPQPVGTLAQHLPISRPAVSQHLAALKAAGLVTDHAQGAKRIYRIDPHGLAAIRAWFDQFWTVSLDAFEAEVSKSEEKDR